MKLIENIKNAGITDYNSRITELIPLYLNNFLRYISGYS